MGRLIEEVFVCSTGLFAVKVAVRFMLELVLENLQNFSFYIIIPMLRLGIVDLIVVLF